MAIPRRKRHAVCRLEGDLDERIAEQEEGLRGERLRIMPTEEDFPRLAARRKAGQYILEIIDYRKEIGRRGGRYLEWLQRDRVPLKPVLLSGTGWSAISQTTGVNTDQTRPGYINTYTVSAKSTYAA